MKTMDEAGLIPQEQEEIQLEIITGGATKSEWSTAKLTVIHEKESA